MSLDPTDGLVRTPCCAKCGTYYQPPIQSDECPHDAAPAPRSAPDSTEVGRLRAVIAAMWGEYNEDQNCDYVRINRLIEEGAEIVIDAIGGLAELDKMAEQPEVDSLGRDPWP